MKRLAKKTKGLIKGTPVAVLVSIGIHAVLIFAAIGWVVFHITKPEEVKFVPVEKIERPVIELKKLQVKVQKDARPKQTPERISTETPKVISDIMLPEMSGTADGLGAGPIGGFEMMEELSKMTLLGGGKSIGNDLVGTYYYFMQNRNGAPSGLTPTGNAPWPGGPVQTLIRDFFAAGWDPSLFDEFWRAPMKLHATQLFVPAVISTVAPDKFGDNRPVEAALWVVHYKGQIAYPDGGRFRFWGYADDLLFVRVNGETVLDASHNYHLPEHLADWSSSAEENMKYQISNAHYRVGDWFQLEPGEPVDMEILVGELPGGTFASMLCVEQEGVEYPEREFGGPLLPIFKTATPPQHIIDEMSFILPEGHVDFEGGPILSVY